MKARVAGVAGSVLALTVIGGFAAASTFQSDPAPVTVQTVQPTDTATVDPTVAPTDTATVAPVVAQTTVAPAPVESAAAPAPVVAPTSEAIVPAPIKSPAPAPAVATQRADQGNDPAFTGLYADGTPVKKDANGDVIWLPATNKNTPAPTSTP